MTKNLVNGKIYVGFHATNKKFNRDNYIGSGELFNKKVLEYGKHNFVMGIIEYINPTEWQEKEKYWIKKMKSHVRYSNGYNLTDGGEGGNTFSSRSKESQDLTRRKLSIANSGKSKSEKECLAISMRMSKNNPGCKKEIKDKVSASLKGKYAGINNPMSGSSRSKQTLENYRNRGIELKGDRWEYMRRKIKLINLRTGEILIFDGTKDLTEKMGISKNKYYRALKDPSIFSDYIFETA